MGGKYASALYVVPAARGKPGERGVGVTGSCSEQPHSGGMDAFNLAWLLRHSPAEVLALRASGFSL